MLLAERQAARRARRLGSGGTWRFCWKVPLELGTPLELEECCGEAVEARSSRLGGFSVRGPWPWTEVRSSHSGPGWPVVVWNACRALVLVRV